MKHVILFFLLLLSIAGFSQSDNPTLSPQNSHIQILRDGKRWFLEAGANGTVLTSNGTELSFDAPTGSGTDSISILQDSIIVLYAIGVEVARDTIHFPEGGTGASTLNEVSIGSTTAPNSIYDMTATVPVEFESSDNNTILLLNETDERVEASNVRIAGLTASEIVATDADKDLVSLAVATYPSLTELSYVKGVTSAIQTQLNAKTSGSGSTGVYSKWSGTTALTDAALHENTASYVTTTTRGITVGDLSGSTAAGFGYRLQRGTLTGGYFASSTDLFFQTSTSHGIRFQTANTDAMMINTNQTVAIGSTGGTTSKLLINDIVQAASGSLFGSALRITQTWNTTGDPTAIFLNVTNTASGGASKLLDLEIGSVSQFYVNKAGNSYLAGSAGIGIITPISKLHSYEDNANTGSTVGLTIEQDGTGDAVEQFLLTGGQRYVQGIDNSDSDKFKLSYDADLSSNPVYGVTTTGVYELYTRFKFGTAATGAEIYPYAGVFPSTINSGGTNLSFFNYNTSENGLAAFAFSGSDLTATTGTSTDVWVTRTFAPTSGNAKYNAVTIIPVINQTGGANGVTRGLYIDPALIAAADFVGIEVNNSDAIIDGKLSTTASTSTLGAAATVIAVTSNVMTITGDAGGNTVATITGARSGTILTLIFVDALVTITDDAGGGSNTVNLSAAFTSTGNDTVTLVFNGTSWREVGRSIN